MWHLFSKAKENHNTWRKTAFGEKFHDIKLLCLLTFNSSKTKGQVGIKSEGECKKSNPEQVRTNVRVGGNTGGLTLKRKKMVSSSFFDGGVWKEFILAAPEMEYCSFRWKATDSSRNGSGLLWYLDLSSLFLLSMKTKEGREGGKGNYMCCRKETTSVNLTWVETPAMSLAVRRFWADYLTILYQCFHI